MRPRKPVCIAVHRAELLERGPQFPPVPIEVPTRPLPLSPAAPAEVPEPPNEVPARPREVPPPVPEVQKQRRGPG